MEEMVPAVLKIISGIGYILAGYFVAKMDHMIGKAQRKRLLRAWQALYRNYLKMIDVGLETIEKQESLLSVDETMDRDHILSDIKRLSRLQLDNLEAMREGLGEFPDLPKWQLISEFLDEKSQRVKTMTETLSQGTRLETLTHEYCMGSRETLEELRKHLDDANRLIESKTDLPDYA